MAAITESSNENIYGFFNLRKDANKEEINIAYRRLCKIYHPDMHTGSEAKAQAEKMFNRVNKFYKILIDDRKRYLYDSIECISPNVLADVEISDTDPETGRLITPGEIIEKYENELEKSKNEKLKHETNPQGAISISIDACDLFRPSDELIYEDDLTSRMPEITSLNIKQSVEAPFGVKDRFIAGGDMLVENGLGIGQISLVWRRILGVSSWSKTQLTIGDNPNFSVKIHGAVLKNIYATGKVSFKLCKTGLVPAVGFDIHKQLDKHFSGIISIGTKPVLRSDGSLASVAHSLTTSIVFDDALRKHGVAFVSLANANFVTGVSMAYRLKDEHESVVQCGVNFSLIGVGLTVGYERKVSSLNSAGVSVNVQYPKGLALKFKWTRSGQQYMANVVVCDQGIYPSAVVYSIILPVVLYNAVSLLTRPYLRMRQTILENLKQAQTKKELEANRKDAHTTIELMRPLASRVMRTEQSSNGLIILEAKYGEADKIKQENYDTDDAVQNVAIPLQSLVKNSSLKLQKTSKAFLPGFYDSCKDKPKLLRISYSFRGSPHSLIVADDEELCLPDSRQTNETVGPTGYD